MKDVEDEEYLFLEYIEHFNIHFNLLLRRYKRFTEINKLQNNDIDDIT